MKVTRFRLRCVMLQLVFLGVPMQQLLVMLHPMNQDQDLHSDVWESPNPCRDEWLKFSGEEVESW